MSLTAGPPSSSIAVKQYYMHITGLRHFRDVDCTFNNSLNSFSHAKWSLSLPRFRRAQHRYVAASQPDINPIVCHRCRWHRRQICRRYRWHRWQISHRCRWYQSTLSCEYLREFSKKFQMALMVYSGAWGKLIHEKNEKQKISWHCPFKRMLSSLLSMHVMISGACSACFKWSLKNVCIMQACA